MSGMMESCFINVKNKSKTITADIDRAGKGAHGIILAQAGRFGGWALYAKDGVPAYDYNFLGLNSTTIAGSQPLTAGKHTLRFDFAYDGGGPGKGGLGTLFVDDTKVAEGRIEHTQGGLFSADETTDVGIDLGTPVVESIGAEAKSRFTGRIPKVTVEVTSRTPSASSCTSAAHAHRQAGRDPHEPRHALFGRVSSTSPSRSRSSNRIPADGSSPCS
jgi:hypothetical protein